MADKLSKRVKALEKETRSLRKAGWNREANLTEQIVNLEVELADLRLQLKQGPAPAPLPNYTFTSGGNTSAGTVDKLPDGTIRVTVPDPEPEPTMVDRELDRAKAAKMFNVDDLLEMLRNQIESHPKRVKRVIAVWECDIHEAFLPDSELSAVYDTGELRKTSTGDYVLVMDSVEDDDRKQEKIEHMLKKAELI